MLGKEVKGPAAGVEKGACLTVAGLVMSSGLSTNVCTISSRIGTLDCVHMCVHVPAQVNLRCHALGAIYI